MIVLPIGGLLLLQLVMAAAPLLAVSFACDSYLAWPWRATAATLWPSPWWRTSLRPPRLDERHEAKTIQVPRRPPMNDGGDSTDLPDEIIQKTDGPRYWRRHGEGPAVKELLQRGAAP